MQPWERGGVSSIGTWGFADGKQPLSVNVLHFAILHGDMNPPIFVNLKRNIFFPKELHRKTGDTDIKGFL